MAKIENKCEVQINGKTYPCQISMAMDLIGGRWKAVILFYLKDGAKRFNELKQSMPTITEMTLSLQLKQLEKNGLITRMVYGEKAPIKVVYEMTAMGAALAPLFDALEVWSEGILKDSGQSIE